MDIWHSAYRQRKIRLTYFDILGESDEELGFSDREWAWTRSKGLKKKRGRHLVVSEYASVLV